MSSAPPPILKAHRTTEPVRRLRLFDTLRSHVPFDTNRLSLAASSKKVAGGRVPATRKSRRIF